MANEFDGSLDDYRDMVLGSGRGRAGDGQGPATKVNRKAERRLAAEAGERNKDLRRAVVQAEADLKLLWQRRAEIDQMLSAPQPNGKSVSELMKTRAEIERDVARAEHRWVEASEAAEQARADRVTGSR
jgi:ATP-binding cassette, subfamily F, member 3